MLTSVSAEGGRWWSWTVTSHLHELHLWADTSSAHGCLLTCWVNTSKAISASYYSHCLTLCGSDSFDGMNSPNGVHSLMCTGVAHYSTLTQLKKNEIIWTCLYILQSQHIGHPTLYHFPEGTPWREWEWSRSKGTSFGAPNTNQSTRSLSHNRFYWLSFWKKKNEPSSYQIHINADKKGIELLVRCCYRQWMEGWWREYWISRASLHDHFEIFAGLGARNRTDNTRKKNPSL